MSAPWEDFQPQNSASTSNPWDDFKTPNNSQQNSVAANAQNIEPGIYGDTDPAEQRIVENAAQVAGGAGLGELGAAAGLGLAKLGSKLGIKAISAALGPSSDAIQARIANPSAITNASSYADLAQKLPDTLNTLKQQISDAAENAYGTLRNSNDPSQGAIAQSQIQGLLNDLSAKFQTGGALIGDAKKAASAKIQTLVNDIGKISKPNVSQISPLTTYSPENYLPETTIKNILRSVDNNINWSDKSLSETNSALTDFRGHLDKSLKSGNPDYAQAMQPVSDKLGLLESLKNAFNITNRTGEGLQPTDATISKIQSLPTERKSITQGLANELNQATGQDYIQQSKNYGYAKQFQGGAANGSRRVASFGGIGTAAGAGIGKLVGAPTAGAITGEALGNAFGLLADKYGGSMAGAVTDRYAPLYQGISRLAANAPDLSKSRSALSTLLGLYYGDNSSSQGSSQ